MTESAIPIALLGFASAERATLAAALQRDPARRPAYRHVLDVDDARFVLADGDQPGVIDLIEILGRMGDAIIVAGQRPRNAAVWLARPIDPRVAREALDRVVMVRDAAGRAGRATTAPATPLAERAPPRSAEAAGRPAAQDAAQLHRDAPPPAERRALLVDDSEVALAFLERRLQRVAVPADRATTSGEALERLSKRSYGIVFVDLDLGQASELDGLALCRAIKRRRTDPGQPAAPVVVLVSAFHDPSDRVRGRLAGADGYLGKPVDVAALDQLLRSHGLDEADPAPRRPPRAGQ